jgi:hypothetical protein
MAVDHASASLLLELEDERGEQIATNTEDNSNTDRYQGVNISVEYVSSNSNEEDNNDGSSRRRKIRYN